MKVKAVGRIVLLGVLPVAAGLLVLVLVIAWLAGMFTRKIPPGQHVAAVRRLEGRPTAVVEKAPAEYLEEAVGTLKAARRTVVASKVLATVEEATVDADDDVEAGTVMFRLSSEELDARLEQAKESLAGAKAQYKERQSTYNRQAELRRNSPGTISQEQFDQTIARLETARANVGRAEQAVNEAEVLLSYTTIKAPRAGRVIDRLAQPGDTVGPGDPLLVLYDPRSLRLEAPVAEKRALTLRRGQQLRVRIDALRDQPGHGEMIGTVDVVVPQAETMSRSFLVKVALAPMEKLSEGMFGRLLIPAGVQSRLTVPRSAVVRIGQLEFADVAGSVPGKADVLERRFIKTGRVGIAAGDNGQAASPAQGPSVEVLSGLEEGDRVVLYPEGDS